MAATRDRWGRICVEMIQGRDSWRKICREGLESVIGDRLQEDEQSKRHTGLNTNGGVNILPFNKVTSPASMYAFI